MTIKIKTSTSVLDITDLVKEIDYSNKLDTKNWITSKEVKLSLVADKSYEPSVGDEITVYSDTVNIFENPSTISIKFTGFVYSVDSTDNKSHSLVCKDNLWYLENQGMFNCEERLNLDQFIRKAMIGMPRKPSILIEDKYKGISLAQSLPHNFGISTLKDIYGWGLAKVNLGRLYNADMFLFIDSTELGSLQLKEIHKQKDEGTYEIKSYRKSSTFNNTANQIIAVQTESKGEDSSQTKVGVYNLNMDSPILMRKVVEVSQSYNDITLEQIAEKFAMQYFPPFNSLRLEIIGGEDLDVGHSIKFESKYYYIQEISTKYSNGFYQTSLTLNEGTIE